MDRLTFLRSAAALAAAPLALPAPAAEPDPERPDLDLDALERESAWARRSVREFAMASSGHGSAFRFDPDIADAVRLTASEAWDAVLDWSSLADTIGGDGRVVHLPTMLVSVGEPKGPESFCWRASLLEGGPFIALTYTHPR